MRIQQLTEQPRRVAAVAFGRMNPPTIGHAKLVDAVKSQAGDPYIFLSQSQKPKTDPLSFEQKIGFAKAFFPGVTVGDPEVRTIFDALNKIYAMGYTDLVYVAGSDRIQQFTDLINKYNGQEDFYSFDSIQVVSAGERDPDAEGAEGMSGSKMRAAATAGDFEAFKSGTPDPKLAQGMYDAVRTGMGMMESLARIIEVAARLRQLHEVKPLTENVKRAFGIVVEAWSEKYKRSINCDNPKGFSQRAHCAGRKKNEGVNEAFDSPYPLVWEGNPNGDSSALAEIPTSNGNTAYLDIEFNTSGDSGRFDISFTRNSRSKASGTGDEFRVFATVIEAIKQWWNKVDQDRVVSITFSAAKNTNDSAMYRGAPDSPRRHILYSRFAKQFAKQIGFKLNIEDLGTGVYFFLTNPKSLSDNKLEEAFDTKVEWIKELGPSGSTVYATKVGDDYIELTYRPASKGVYISFTRGGVMSVTGEGSQNKIFGAVINHIKQWAAKNKPEQIMFSAFKPRTGAFGSQDSTRSGLYRKMVQRFANQNGYEYDVEDTGNEDTFILKRQGVAEGKKTNKAFVKPQFDVEWEEAARYSEFQKIGKDAWIELAKKGKSVTIKSAKGINNTDAADPDSFKSLEPEKQKRALAQLEKGTVEMPIVAVYSDGYKELIGGNTRLTAMMARDGKATVWAFKVPDEVAKLAENFAEGKSPHKKGTKKYKAHMAAMHAGMNESYKLQLERDDDLLVLHIKDTKTGKRTEVRGKPNYEGDGYDSDDKLHQLLDKIGKAANMSDLMNGEVVTINPRHPDGPEAKERVQKVVGEAGVGRITKQNATKDAPIGSEFANVKKLGLGSGKPKELHAKARKNSDPNTLFNLGLVEGQLNEKGSIGIPLSSGMTVVIAPHRPLKVKKSKKKVKMVGAGEEE
jgi:hypothetical protein